MKTKKLSIKLYLDKRKDQAVGYFENDIERLAYPLYIQVIYNRNNTKFASIYARYHYPDINEIKLMSPGLLEFEERIVRKISMFEIENRGEAFDLKGLNKLYQKYALSIHSVLSDMLLNDFNLMVKSISPAYWSVLNFEPGIRSFFKVYQLVNNSVPEFENKIDNKFLTRVEAVKAYYNIYEKKSFNFHKNAQWFKEGEYGALFPEEFTFPAVIDWIDGNNKQYTADGMKKIELDDNKIEQYVNIIDSMIRESLT